MFKLYDYISVEPGKKISSLKDEDKKELMDSITSKRKTKKGLFITYDLSHSGRRINNRIYGTKGQQEGSLTVMKPYAKPILQHHDKDRDPIGRFVSAEWEDLSQEAMKFFNRIEDFVEVKTAYDSDDPDQIYQVMKKYNLLGNKDWPGLGRIRVKAQITDKEAIEKFLDGRYITFSAGSTTDRHVCSICSSDWAKGDFCEHRHGKIYDGDVCVFITGKFNVLEGSVVNMPADDLSQLHSMEFIEDQKNLDNKIKDNEKFELERNNIIISDSLYVLEDYSEMEDDKKEDLSKEEVEVKDQVEESETETEKSLEDNIVEKISKIIFEKYDKVFEKLMKNEKEEENKSSSEDAKSEVEEQENEDSTSDGSSVRGVQAELPNESKDQKEVGNVDGDLSNLIKDDVEVDWYLLDAALTVELEDKALTTEQRKELPDSAFCGPERSFPVNDCAHVTAARRLIGKAKLSDSQKEKVLSCVNKKASSMKCDEQKDGSFFMNEIEMLKKEIQSLKEELKKDSKELEKESDKLEEVTLENPSVVSSDESSVTESSIVDKLGSYEKKFIKQYNEILQRDGEITANNFFSLKSRYLKKGFDPKKYII